MFELLTKARQVFGLGAGRVDVVGAVVCNGKTIVCVKDGETLVLYEAGSPPTPLAVIENVRKTPDGTMMFTASDSRICLFALRTVARPRTVHNLEVKPDRQEPVAWQKLVYTVNTEEEGGGVTADNYIETIGYSDRFDIMHMGGISDESPTRFRAVIDTDTVQLRVMSFSNSVAVSGPRGILHPPVPVATPARGVKFTCGGLMPGTSWTLGLHNDVPDADGRATPPLLKLTFRADSTDGDFFDGAITDFPYSDLIPERFQDDVCFGMAVVCDDLVLGVRAPGAVASAAKLLCARITDHTVGSIGQVVEMTPPHWGDAFIPKQMVWNGYPFNRLVIAGLEGTVPATRLVVDGLDLSTGTWGEFVRSLLVNPQKMEAVKATLMAGNRIRMRVGGLPALPEEIMEIIARTSVQMDWEPAHIPISYPRGGGAPMGAFIDMCTPDLAVNARVE